MMSLRFVYQMFKLSFYRKSICLREFFEEEQGDLYVFAETSAKCLVFILTCK